MELREGFTIDNDQTADWALRKIAENNAECARLVAIGEAQIAELTEHIQSLEEEYKRKNTGLIELLRIYFESVEHSETATTEKYKLFSGTLKKKKASRKPVTPDDVVLMEYLVGNGLGDYYEEQIKVKWGEFKKALDFSGDKAVIKATGEIVDFIEFEDVPESFYVEVK